jgi:two-component system, NarL family, sensor histidine kinase UhpB
MFSIRPSSWSLTARLLLTAALPVLLMFAALTTSLYLSGKSEVATIVQANGQLLARTLAQTSPFSIVSGNTAALERSVDRLLQSQTDIAAIEILDERHQPIVSRGSQTNHKTSKNTYLFEQTIAADVPNVDLFDGNTPHIANPASSQAPKFRTGRTVGYVRVTLSPNSILAEQRKRLYANALVTAIAFAISLFMAFYLAQRIQKPLNQVMRALRDIRSGQFNITFDSKINKSNSTNGEIAELQSTVIAMAQGLAVKREELEHQVQTRTEDLRLAVERAQASDNERRRLLAHSTDVIEEERKRIAMDMHDEFNASLIGIRMQAESMLPHPGTALDLDTVESRAQLIITTVNQLYADARRLIKRLRPEMLDILGLEGAIDGAVRTFNRDQDACHLVLHIEPHLPKVPDKAAIAAYRVVQEALSNILKHSGATEGSVHMGLDDESGQIEIQVRDNGKGFDSTTKSNGFGLLGMRERIESVGGEFRVFSGDGLGTSIEISFPVV